MPDLTGSTPALPAAAAGTLTLGGALDYCERHGIAFIPWFPLEARQLAGMT